MPIETQQEFLAACKRELDLTWDAFATLVDVKPRAFKSYRMPTTATGNYREMNRFIRSAIQQAMAAHRKTKN